MATSFPGFSPTRPTEREREPGNKVVTIEHLQSSGKAPETIQRLKMEQRMSAIRSAHSRSSLTEI